MRSIAPGLVLGIGLTVVAACSGGDDRGALDVPEPTIAGAPDDGRATPAVGADDEATAAAARPDSLSLTVEWPGGATTFERAIDDPAVLEPFGTFASCSGWRRSIGTYEVTVSEPGDPLGAIGVLTVSPIDGPGIHDADVRIEPSEGPAVVATGTLTLDDDLRSGTFVAFGPDGQRLAGSFACASDRPPPEPLGDDGVDVVALLRRDGRQRVLGLTVPADEAICRAASGAAESPVVVRVDGDQRVGAITTFELTDADPGTLRIRAGGMVLESTDVSIDLDPDAASGTFAAIGADGIAIDGAFRCG